MTCQLCNDAGCIVVVHPSCVRAGVIIAGIAVRSLMVACDCSPSPGEAITFAQYTDLIGGIDGRELWERHQAVERARQSEGDDWPSEFRRNFPNLGAMLR